jgi:hypothetical protein
VYSAAGEPESTVPEKDAMEKAGYKILVRPSLVDRSRKGKADKQASIAESGLGVISWWNQGEQEEEMEEQLEE